MARDEALWRRVGRGESPATLRFYRWQPATMSLGYFQSMDEYATTAEASNGTPIVRRLTGGGAILHDDELTYSLALPRGHRLLVGGPTQLYEIVHDAAADVLAEFGIAAARAGCCDGKAGRAEGVRAMRPPRLGRRRREGEPFYCFARLHPLDLVVGGAKVMGSAQRRSGKSVLQHGSLIFASALAEQTGPVAMAALRDRLDTVIERLTRRVCDPQDVSVERGEWSAAELNEAEELVASNSSCELCRESFLDIQRGPRKDSRSSD